MSHSHSQFRRRRGFTLVELLVVIAVIVILMSIALPAINNARINALKLQCGTNLRNLAQGMMGHLTTHNAYPSGGWGSSWAPHPDRGVGLKQPGGWTYQILPQIEQSPLFEQGQGGGPNNPANLAANQDRIKQFIPGFYCPVRRRASAYPLPSMTVNGSDPVVLSGRTDYAANGGAIHVSFGAGPPPTAIGQPNPPNFPPNKDATGIVVAGSPVPRARVNAGDGDSNTLMIAEKCLSLQNYANGLSQGDDGGPFIADEKDSVRFASVRNGATITVLLPVQDAKVKLDPDAANKELYGFGSSHNTGVNAIFCDTSIKTIGFGVDPKVLGRITNRQDREVIDWGSL